MIAKKMMTGLIATTFFMGQLAGATAVAQADKAAVQFEAQMEALQSESSLAQMEASLDAMASQYSSQDAVDAQAVKRLDTHSKRWHRLKERWASRFERRAPHLVQKVNDRLNQPTEALQAMVASGLTQAKNSGEKKRIDFYTGLSKLAPEELKPALIKSSQEIIANASDLLSSKIADRGGIVPFVVNMKADIQTLRLTLKAKKEGRSLASDGHSLMWNILMYSVVIAVLGVGFYLSATSFTTAGIVGYMLGTIALETIIIDLTGVGRKNVE